MPTDVEEKIRFQADADFNQRIVKATLRCEPTIDFQTAHVAGILGLPDTEVLQAAASDRRVVVSHDQTTMPTYFGQFISTGTSPGLIIVPQHLSIAIVVEALILIWMVETHEQWVNRICYLPSR